MITSRIVCLAAVLLLTCRPASAQLGSRFSSERKVVPDPVTGVELTFLTSTPGGDSKIYPTHPQWTADGEWVIFRSGRVRGEALAVHETTGDMVQVTEGGYRGALCIAQKSMRLFYCRSPRPSSDSSSERAERSGGRRRRGGPPTPLEVVSIDLKRLFADSAADALEPASAYENVYGTIPVEYGGAGELALDANEDFVYFRMVEEAAAQLLAEDAEIAEDFGPRGMGAGPTGVAKMELASGKVSPVVAVHFQVGHIQSNPWVSGEIVFCWETGGKAPQRAWTVKADGTGLSPLFPESDYDWVTHEAITGPDEVALAILGHRRVGVDDDWGKAGSRTRPTGLAIVNLRTRELILEGQTRSGSGLWHVHASRDGRWAVGDDFARNLWLIDRRTHEMRLLSTGHKSTAADHVHPTFKPDGTKIQIQSAMLSEGGRSMNICIVPVPKDWLAREYDTTVFPPADYEADDPGRP
jgi:oligogalacturonide lyase